MKTILFLLLIFQGQSILAQSISGMVRDKETGEVVQYVYVSVKGSNTATITNNEGVFKLLIDKIKDSDSLKFSHVSYETKFLSVQTLKQNEQNTIELQPLVVSLNEVIVSGQDPFDYFSKAISSTQVKMHYPFSANVYYREIVKDNNESSKYADAILNVNYADNKDDIIIGVEQARVIQLPKETDDIVDIASPIDVTKLFEYQYLTILNRFRGENRKDYNYSMHEHTGKSNTYTIEIDPIGTTEKNKVLYFAEIVVENEYITDVVLRMDTTTHWEKSFLGVSVRIADMQIVLSFNGINGASYLSFGKMYLKMIFNSKKFKQTNEYQSDFVVTNVDLNQLKSIDKKKRLKSKTIYKHGDDHVSNFWEGVNIPIQSKIENELIEKLKAGQVK